MYTITIVLPSCRWLAMSNQIKSNQIYQQKNKVQITQTKTIQLVSYGVRKVLKIKTLIPPPKKKENK